MHDPQPPPAGEAGALEAQGVHAWFGSTPVLAGIDLVAPRSTVTAVLGPRGSGRTTLLRVLNRMHELDPHARRSGRVLLDGVDVYGPASSAADTRARIGMLGPHPTPFPTMSIRDNVVAGHRLTGSSPDRDLVERSLRRAGLWEELADRLDAPGAALPLEHQQRLCLARLLALDPRVVLMDDPCASLDTAATRRTETTIRRLAREVTVVVVTDDLQQASRISDRCAVLLPDRDGAGRIVESGDTDEVFLAPTSRRAEAFLSGHLA